MGFFRGKFPRGKFREPKIPSSQAAAAAAAAASAAWFHILNVSQLDAGPAGRSQRSWLVEPKKTTVAEVQVEWRCGEVWFNNQKMVRDDVFFLWKRDMSLFWKIFVESLFL